MRNALIVFLGGAIGTFLRAGIDVALTGGRLSATTLLACNVIGSLALGILIRALGPAVEDSEARCQFRLFAGTGLIGGFTSYSSFAVLAGTVLAGGAPVPGVVYALLTVLAGVAAALIGTMLVPDGAAHDRRGRRSGPEGGAP
ncbi:CrcB protein [Brevibacterium sanguinis]|uniref:Fluoride-specific ion channel FluC n=3 Tax=Brevibacteriaceae TaxID=85019 RepID=A0A366IIP2_9MICO|nr:CrcB protein [Brevibacterium sanguinis]RBP71487.1 CrcB protein [Brevibacterium celere]